MRIPEGASPASTLDPNRWYEARQSDGSDDLYDVKLDGERLAGLPASLFDVRTVPDDEWEHFGLGPMANVTGGRPVPAVTPLVECPIGHRRRTAYSEQTETRLRCDECGRDYAIDWNREPGRP